MIRVIVLALALLVPACAGLGTPEADTMEKKLFAAEVTYNETLKLIDRNINRLSQSKRVKIADALKRVKVALDAARIAVRDLDTLNFDTNISIINSSIRIIRPILEDLEQEVSYGSDIQFTYST